MPGELRRFSVSGDIKTKYLSLFITYHLGQQGDFWQSNIKKNTPLTLQILIISNDNNVKVQQSFAIDSTTHTYVSISDR